MTEADILKLIEGDPWMMGVLRQAAELNLPNWAVGAGFVRNKVWDALHCIERPGVDATDVDLVYYDAERQDRDADKELSAALAARTGINWEIRNTAYMGQRWNLPPYRSVEEAMSTWVETATAVGVRLEGGRLTLVAPLGIDDLVNLVLRPCPAYADRPEALRERAAKKHWLEKWPKLRFSFELK